MKCWRNFLSLSLCSHGTMPSALQWNFPPDWWIWLPGFLALFIFLLSKYFRETYNHSDTHTHTHTHEHYPADPFFYSCGCPVWRDNFTFDSGPQCNRKNNICSRLINAPIIAMLYYYTTILLPLLLFLFTHTHTHTHTFLDKVLTWEL